MLIRVAAGIVAVVVLVAAAFTAWLVFPSAPKSTASLQFQGFVTLPKASGAGALSILDYISVVDRNLFVAGESSGLVYRVRLGNEPLPGPADVAVLPGKPSVHGIVVDPVSQMAFASRSDANTVDVFDPRAMRLIKRIPVDDDVDGIFFDPSDKLVYAVNGDPRVATLIDPALQAKVGTIPLGGTPEFAAFDPKTGRFYQNLVDSNSVAVVDPIKRSVEDRWPLKGCLGPTGMALDAQDRRLFIVCSKNDIMVVLDLTNHNVISSTPIGGGPDSVAYDPGLHRLYTTGKSGVLTVIGQEGADAYRALDTIKLHYGAHTLALDPATHRVYVGYASLLIAPRLAVFTATR